MRFVQVILTVITTGLILRCGDSNVIGALFYQPSVYFAGYINGTYDSLTGNYSYKNFCKLVNDTIRMFIYSSEFNVGNNIWDGDFIRMDIYPGSDSALGRANILFHMARYHGANASYTVTPADTLYGYDNIQFTVRELDRRHGGTVSLENIAINAELMDGTTGEELVIVKGRIEGTIE